MTNPIFRLVPGIIIEARRDKPLHGVPGSPSLFAAFFSHISHWKNNIHLLSFSKEDTNSHPAVNVYSAELSFDPSQTSFTPCLKLLLLATRTVCICPVIGIVLEITFNHLYSCLFGSHFTALHRI